MSADGIGPERMAALVESAGPSGPGDAMEAAHQIARRTGVGRHDLLVVLGSGAAGALATWGTPTASLPLSDLPGVLAPVGPGQEDCLDSFVRVEVGGPVRVLVARGRTHLYEGHGSGPVVALGRAAAATGVRAAVLVDAGCCLRDWRIGEVMTITDHLNLTGASPFVSPVSSDVRGVWDAGLAGVLGGVTGRAGVYAALRGPEHRTPAETRMLAVLGADCVGMSTVLEAVALRRLGVRVAGTSIVSDKSLIEENVEPDEAAHLAVGAHAVVTRGIEAVLASL